MIGVLFLLVLWILSLYGLFLWFRLEKKMAAVSPAGTSLKAVRTAGNLWLIGCSLLFVLVLLEAYLQLKYRGERFRGNPWYSGGNHPRNLVEPDSVLGYRLRPNFSGTEISIWGDFRTPVNINSLGMRDREHNLLRPQIAILLVGDSYAFGEGVPLEKSYAWLLEERLNQACKSLPIDIYKAGVPAYNLRQELLTVKRFLALRRIDWVIFTLSTKRIERLFDDYTYFKGFIIKKSYIPRLTEIHGNLYEWKYDWTPRKQIHLFLQAYVYSYNFLKYRFPNFGRDLRRYLERRFPDRFPPRKDTITPAKQAQFDRDYQAAVQILTELAQLQTQHAFQVLVVLYDGFPTQDERIIRYCRQQGIPILNTATAIDSAVARGIRVKFKRDGHWNENGHRIAADLLFQFFASHCESWRRRKVIPSADRKAAAPADGLVPAGEHRLKWTPDHEIPAGVYAARRQAEGQVQVRKMVLAR